MSCNGCGSPDTCWHLTNMDTTPKTELNYCLACVVPRTVGTPFEAAARDFHAHRVAIDAWVKDHEDFMKRVSPRVVASAAFVAGRKFERDQRKESA